MNSDAIFDVIEATAEAKGKDKQVILERYIDDPDFERVLKAALDPFVTYGIAKVPEPDPNVTCDELQFGADTWMQAPQGCF